MALNFVAATPDSVGFSDNAAYDLGTDATIFMWVNSDTGDDGTSNRFFVNADATQAARWGLSRAANGTDDQTQAAFRNASDVIIPNGAVLAGTNALDTSLHCHSSTYDGTTMRLYYDGSEDVNAADTDTIHTIANTVYFGKHPNDLEANAFDGWLEHGAVWNTEVPVTHQAALSRGVNPFAILNSSLVIYCPMYTADGADWSPTLNNGTVTTATKFAGGAPVELIENYL